MGRVPCQLFLLTSDSHVSSCQLHWFIPVDFDIELGVPCQLYWFIPVDLDIELGVPC